MLLASGRRVLLSGRVSNLARGFAEAQASGRVKELRSNQDFTAALNGSSGQLSVIDFTAAWCGPCKVMAPIYAALSEKYTTVSFYKADIDDDTILDSVAAQDVQAVPTFTFHKGGKKLAAVTGADPSQIKKLLEEHQ
ncbi:hypothetical protein WJX74_010350 [Apatococcus lobatus]|uniref:Thioredoxin domain-containing protein n=1 Tax=Apatococcus lobatus TaxID=904363 RepID=A0AAW1QJ28_9CHLO